MAALASTRRAITCGAAGLLASCALTVDTTGLSGPLPEADSSVSADAADSDRSLPDDASADALTDGDAAYCEPPSRFCTTFDGVRLESFIVAKENGAVTIDSSMSVSPPSALLVSVDAPPRAAHAGIEVPLEATTAKMRVAFDLRVIEQATEYTEVVSLRSQGTARECWVYLFTMNGQWSVESACDGTTKFTARIGPVAPTQWERVEISLDTGTLTGSAKIGAAASNFTFDPILATAAVNLFAGVYYTRDGGRIRLAIDNLRID
jgi:hypothetical protein